MRMVLQFVLQSMFLIALGFTALVLSSRLAIRSLVRISRHYGVPEFVISFLLVGVVAVLPELSIGINSALDGASSFGLGIVFGSNIADLTLIIGLVALASGGITIHKFALKQLRIFSVATVLPLLLLIDGALSRLDGALLVASFLIYLAFIAAERKGWHQSLVMKERASMPKELVTLGAALVLLFFAGSFVTESAVALSSGIAAPLFFIGILVAVGTCLPELNFAIQAARSRHEDLGFGEIIGNVLADCMLTAGIIAMVNPVVPTNLGVALLGTAIMACSMLFLVFLFSKKPSITREQGFGLVILYLVLLCVQIFAEKVFFAAA